MLQRIVWWMENEQEVAPTLGNLDPGRVRSFLAYLREPRPEGRWGNGHWASKKEPRPSTLNAYFRTLRALANWLLAEGLIETSFVKNVRAPKCPKDKINPLSEEDVQKMIDAARRTRNPERNAAIILLLVDSGLRAAELCSLKVRDVDRDSGEINVVGKGKKRRPVYVGQRARRAVFKWLEERKGSKGDDPLFISEGGLTPGDKLTPGGLFRIVQACGKGAGVAGVGPHDLRRSFAVFYLKNGGDLFSLQAIMGHESLTVLRRYVELAQRDVSEIHRANSPADRLKLR